MSAEIMAIASDLIQALELHGAVTESLTDESSPSVIIQLSPGAATKLVGLLNEWDDNTMRSYDVKRSR